MKADLNPADIADRINAHLKRFEGDRRINRSPRKNRPDMKPFLNPCAYYIGRFIFISYRHDPGVVRNVICLNTREASAYLNWLDSGGVGKFTDMSPMPMIHYGQPDKVCSRCGDIISHGLIACEKCATAALGRKRRKRLEDKQVKIEVDSINVK